MQNIAGLWIDHARARIVNEADGARTTRVIESGAEPRRRSMGLKGTRLPAHLGGNPEFTYVRRRREELKRYYAEVAAALGACDGLLILGPGEAKLEFERYLRQKPSGVRRVLGVEPADKLTAPQIAAITRRAWERAEEELSKARRRPRRRGPMAQAARKHRRGKPSVKPLVEVRPQKRRPSRTGG